MSDAPSPPARLDAGRTPHDGHGRVTIQSTETVASGRYPLRRYTFDYRRRDGAWQRLAREVYFRADSAVVLLHCAARGTVILTRQFRLPVFIAGHADGLLIEAAGGLLDGEAAHAAIRREAEEETGFRVARVEEVLDAYMSPAVLAERVHFFIAAVDPVDWASPGGGAPEEGEDVEVLEVLLEDALAMIEDREIVDGRTIILLQYLALRTLCRPASRWGPGRRAIRRTLG